MNTEQFPQDKRIILTKHCIERFKEFGFTKIPEMVKFVKQGLLEELDPKQKEYKEMKYNDQNPAKHYRNGSYVYPVVETVSKFTGKEIYLVITIYDQKVDL